MHWRYQLHFAGSPDIFIAQKFLSIYLQQVHTWEIKRRGLDFSLALSYALDLNSFLPVALPTTVTLALPTFL